MAIAPRATGTIAFFTTVLGNAPSPPQHHVSRAAGRSARPLRFDKQWRRAWALSSIRCSRPRRPSRLCSARSAVATDNPIDQNPSDGVPVLLCHFDDSRPEHAASRPARRRGKTLSGQELRRPRQVRDLASMHPCERFPLSRHSRRSQGSLPEHVSGLVSVRRSDKVVLVARPR